LDIKIEHSDPLIALIALIDPLIEIIFVLIQQKVFTKCDNEQSGSWSIATIAPATHYDDSMPNILTHKVGGNESGPSIHIFGRSTVIIGEQNENYYAYSNACNSDDIRITDAG
jgi:hypothetical protein